MLRKITSADYSAKKNVTIFTLECGHDQKFIGRHTFRQDDQMWCSRCVAGHEVIEITEKTALEKSIDHWRDNTEAQHYYQASINHKDCALCGEFFEKDCHGCPISEKTGRARCFSTPYTLAASNWFSWRNNPSSLTARDNFRKASLKELYFLMEIKKNG